MNASWRDAGRLRRALRVYVITDDVLSRGRPTDHIVAAALAGGATAIQLRSKTMSARELCEMGRALRQLCAERQALFVVNDRLDVALACGADGVHLGQDDLPCTQAREIAGPDFVIGVSAGTGEEARAAVRAGADYLGTGAVFATRSKADAGEPIGPAGLRGVAAVSEVPVVAIGGIAPNNAAAAIAAGAAGVAVISAVVAQDDVIAATSRIAAAVQGGFGASSWTDAP